MYLDRFPRHWLLSAKSNNNAPRKDSVRELEQILSSSMSVLIRQGLVTEEERSGEPFTNSSVNKRVFRVNFRDYLASRQRSIDNSEQSAVFCQQNNCPVTTSVTRLDEPSWLVSLLFRDEIIYSIVSLFRYSITLCSSNSFTSFLAIVILLSIFQFISLHWELREQLGRHILSAEQFSRRNKLLDDNICSIVPLFYYSVIPRSSHPSVPFLVISHQSFNYTSPKRARHKETV